MKHKNNFKENYHFKAFNFGILLSLIMFLPFIILDGGRFTFYGDFNIQQIAFYELAHSAILDGNISWSSTTDLGANFIGSYSNYVLGSPFFWISLIVPNNALQYMMGPFLIIKFALASCTACVFLQRYVKDKNNAVMGGLVYAFSGFSIYNIFLGHFFEPIIIFPLLLAALDTYVLDKRRGYLAITVFASCIVNYSFFAGQIVFVVIYFLVRVATKSYKLNFKEFLMLVFEGILGIMMAMILLLPAVFYLLQNTRLGEVVNGVDALVYKDSTRYIEIIESLFFPMDLSATNTRVNLSALGAWLPLFGMTGVLAWMQQKRKHWLKKLLYILFFAAFIPFLNSAFNLFNSEYSAIWFYILSLMMVLASLMSLENKHINFKRALKYCTAVTFILMVAIGLVPTRVENGGEYITVFGISENPERFCVHAALAMLSLAILTCIIRYIPKMKIEKYCFVAVAIICVMQGSYFIGIGVEQSEKRNFSNVPFTVGSEGFLLEDLDCSRSDFYSSVNNASIFLEIPSIQAVHSDIAGSVADFYEYIGIDREFYANPSTEDYVVRALTSVRWLFDDINDRNYFGTVSYDAPQMNGFHYYGTENGYDIWENMYYINMGFEYDSYIPISETKDLSDEHKQLLMLKTAIIPDEDEVVWSKYLNKYDINEAIYSQDLYYTDCTDRASSVVNYFEYTKNGFSALSSSDESRMIFFSVPYDEGWTAYIDGVETQILKTNVGFMSVYVPTNQNSNIVFTYKTPGLNMGIIITAIAVVVFIFYIRYKKGIFKSKEKSSNIIIHKRRCEKFDKYCQRTGFVRDKNGIKIKR